MGNVKGLVTQTEGLAISPLVAAAQGVGPFGAQLTVSPSFVAAGDGPTDLAIGTHLNFDILGVSEHVPVAVTGEYLISFEFPFQQTQVDRETGEEQLFESELDLSHTIGGGLYYSGRRDFTIGVNGGVLLFSGLTIADGNMVMQYFF